MENKRTIFYLIILIIFLVALTTASPIFNDIKTNTDRYFDEIMNELNEALKEKAVEERKHISLLLNMTEEMKELSAQVRGMQKKLEKIAG